MHLVAHRAGNDPATARAALERADLVEFDVHVLAGRVEVRHAKVARPTRRLWEKWYLLPRGARGLPIAEALAAIGPDVALLVDLKCFTVRAARRIGDALPADRELVVSARSWWVLRAFRDRPRTVALRSCGNRAQLRVVGLVPGLGLATGVAAHERLLDAAVASRLRRRTPHLFSWGVATVARGRELAALGVNGLIVDDLSLDWRSLDRPRGDRRPCGPGGKDERARRAGGRYG